MARIVGVSAKSITAACNEGRALFAACEGKRIDASHPAAIAYIKKHTKNSQQSEKKEQESPKKENKPSGWTAKNEQKKREIEDSKIEIPDDILMFADMSLRDLINQFGTDTRFLDWLRATKEIEIINEKRLKNAQTKGELVSRELIKNGVIDPINSAHIKMLTDGSKTIARRSVAMHESGRKLDEIEKFVVDQISSFIKPMKAKIARTLANG